MSERRLTIILADDDDGHATLIRRNLERSRLDARIVRLRDGQDVVDYFVNQRCELPALLLLDIHMPRLDGIEALRRIKDDPVAKMVPVYMLTTTDNPREVDRCFELGCNAYLTKPVAYEELVTTIQRLCSFLEVVRIPGEAPHGRFDAPI
jgi:CheY-like chemotaxis protein